ncbi:Lrp/AsnC family transcriptional regulator [Pacificibacter marinus]|uniref:Leucine-responsive regulatory protein n=1 Tax=Pacificibacter marinus TaxID=658057 RepID=A0A1Y5THP1_9RHOB|nr:Lrp/AsnC family transcriptional regulator [Pacificibacter marinus]SEL26526.1 transcriptional regulator, AsnC family [Pacificibacter marinus]SLN64342.1 Leucine-responsive regulatory protein [Pacificibacter marinus]
MDVFDRKILSALQHDGRLTNGELAERVGLSSSQCSRRRTQLELSGVIEGYVARVNPLKVGIALTSMISVTLNNHNESNAEDLRKLLKSNEKVLDAYALTGEMDYHIKVVSADLEDLSDFINKVLLSHDAVQNVRTSIALGTIKSSTVLPLDQA